MTAENRGHGGDVSQDRLPPTVTRALQKISTHGDQLALPDETIVKAELLCVQAMMEAGVSRTPAAVAAGSLYAAALLDNGQLSQQAVGSAVDVTANTVRTAHTDVLAADGFERTTDGGSAFRKPRGGSHE